MATSYVDKRQYRIISAQAGDPNDGATCFLDPSQTLGYGLPDPVPAYSPGRESRPVEVPLITIQGFEEV